MVGFDLGQFGFNPTVALGNGLARVALAGVALAGVVFLPTPIARSAEPLNLSAASQSLCPPPVLSRLTRHRVTAGETLDGIAQRYGLITATVIGLNPDLQTAGVKVGQELMIPPYNGIRVSVSPGQTWDQVAAAYNTRADVLFEVNGCVSTVPATIFVPGVNWFPGVRTAATPAANTPSRRSPLQGYPLPSRTDVIVNYGWQPDLNQNKLVCNTGGALASTANTPVLAVGAGTVAFAGVDAVYGNLVVVNHADGLQTRYANLDQVTVTLGQTVRQGDHLGQVAAPSTEPSTFLYFEVRLNSPMGWVAQDPQDFVPAMALR
ncbi:MAG TPA: M23 family metallopeptidase [Leptolyngbyaceae cyanobacterium M65_K2018_010]|nr:M23 family metallopeptidase [Leptolyngbyaceae cyanobacterium M65_K2018_010]